MAVITPPDERWAHPHIKSLQLLPNVLAKQAAREAGAFEAWLVDGDGFVTEGSSTNAWIVAADGALVTRQADQSILRGVTRSTLLDVVAAEGLRLRGAAVHSRGGLRGARGVSFQRHDHRHAGRRDRRPADRRRPAGSDNPGVAAKIRRGGGAQLKRGRSRRKTARWRIAPEMI